MPILAYDHIDRHLAQKGIQPLYVLHGDEFLLSQESLDLLKAAAKQAGFNERHVLIVEKGFQWQQLFLVSQSISLFGDKPLIELRIPTGKPGKEGASSLQKFCQSANKDVFTVIQLPRLDKATQSSAWFNALQTHAECIAIPSIGIRELPSWIKHRLAQQKQTTSNIAIQFITDKVEGNLLAAFQEIQKLALLYPEGKLSDEMIYESVLNVARYHVFQLGEVLLANDRARFVRILEGLAGEGEAVVLVHWAITEEIRTLYKVAVQIKQGIPIGQALKQHRIWGEREKLYQRKLPQIRLNRLREGLQFSGLVDKAIKGLKPPEITHDLWQALYELGDFLITSDKTLVN